MSKVQEIDSQNWNHLKNLSKSEIIEFLKKEYLKAPFLYNVLAFKWNTESKNISNESIGFYKKSQNLLDILIKAREKYDKNGSKSYKPFKKAHDNYMAHIKNEKKIKSRQKRNDKLYKRLDTLMIGGSNE